MGSLVTPLHVSAVRSSQKVKDKKLRHHLQKSDSRSEHAAKKAARMELLLPEEPG